MQTNGTFERAAFNPLVFDCVRTYTLLNRPRPFKSRPLSGSGRTTGRGR